MTTYNIAVAAPIEAYSSSFENASSVMTFTIVPGVYPVEFKDNRGFACSAEDAADAIVAFDIENAMFSYKWETPSPSSTSKYHARLYGYEFRAGKDFFALVDGGAAHFTPQAA